MTTAEAQVPACARHRQYALGAAAAIEPALEQVWDAVDSLEHLPRRAAKAQEDEFVAYEVRQLVVGGHLLLFTIDDDELLLMREEDILAVIE